MCRLFAYIAPESSTADAELGPDGWDGFVSLARLHGDGWGWAGVSHAGEAPVVEKSPASAAKDPRFSETLRTPVQAAMVHLRWATAGIPIEACNAHPFRGGDVAFEHNGSLKPIERARALLSPTALASMTGDTDSEMYFALIREKIGQGASVEDATVDVVRRLRDEFPTASLNAILLDRDTMVVVHASARSALVGDDLEEIARVDGLPDDHNDDYFALRWLRKPDGTVLVGSSGVALRSWDALPAESVTVIRLADRAARTIMLDPSFATVEA